MALMISLKSSIKKDKVREAVSPGIEGFRVISEREVAPTIHSRMLRLAKILYDSNPLARRIVELTKNFILGEGILYEAKDKRVKEILDNFWFDDINNWPIRQHERILDLCLYGELIIPVEVNPKNGHVTLGYIDPLQVQDVVTNPLNCLVYEKIIVKGLSDNRTDLRVIKKDRNPLSKTFGRLMGEVFFFAINKVSNQTRGTSDLLPLIDWLDAYDQFLFNRLERQSFINNFVWDVTLEGADDSEIEEFKKNLIAPTPGTIRIHNERVKWNVINPKLESSDAQAESQLLRSHILAGAGYPPHFFSDFSGVRATAYESYFPTEKNLVSRQKIIKGFLEYIFRFVIDQAIIHNTLPPNIDTSFEVIFPEISIRDLERTSRALRNITLALSDARDAGWLTDEECRRTISSVLSQIGMPLREGKQQNVEDSIHPVTNNSKVADIYTEQSVGGKNGKNIKKKGE